MRCSTVFEVCKCGNRMTPEEASSFDCCSECLYWQNEMLNDSKNSYKILNLINDPDDEKEIKKLFDEDEDKDI